MVILRVLRQLRIRFIWSQVQGGYSRGSRGADGESVLYNIYATGVGTDYEIEGLAYDGSQRVLLLMCKSPRREELKEQLVIYHWSTDEKQLIEDAHIVIPVIEFTRHIEGKEFQPSGIERHPVSGNYFVIAARQRAIAEITPGGQVVVVKRFPAEWHRQPEGITFAVDGSTHQLRMKDRVRKRDSHFIRFRKIGNSSARIYLC